MKWPAFLPTRRGEHLVQIQVLLFLAFIFAPNWNPFVSDELLAVSVPLRWAALVLLWIPAVLLGGLGFINIRKYLTPLPYPVDHNRLVMHGVYRLVRHPLYSSQLFAALGWVLFTLSLSHLLLLVIGFFFFDYKASREEGWLTERHPEYSDYSKRVRKLIPYLY